MGIRVGSTGARAFARLARTTNLPTRTAFSFSAWIKVNSYVATTYGNFLLFDDVGVYYLQVQRDGANWGYYCGGTGGSGWTSLGSYPSTGTWFHLGLTISGTSLTVYKDGESVGTGTMSSTSWTPGYIWLGGTTYDGGSNATEQLDVTYAAVKVFSSALTQADIQLEMRTTRPQGRGTSNGWAPGFVNANDYSGLGYNWTETGTITYVDGPPVGWGAPIGAEGGTTLPVVTATIAAATGATLSGTVAAGATLSPGAVTATGISLEAALAAGVGLTPTAAIASGVALQTSLSAGVGLMPTVAIATGATLEAALSAGTVIGPGTIHPSIGL